MLEKTTNRAAPPTAQQKRERFVRLAENRTKNAIRMIRRIGKLGNRNAYAYDESDIQKIVKALLAEVESVKTRLSAKGGKDTVAFKL